MTSDFSEVGKERESADKRNVVNFTEGGKGSPPQSVAQEPDTTSENSHDTAKLVDCMSEHQDETKLHLIKQDIDGVISN